MSALNPKIPSINPSNGRDDLHIETTTLSDGREATVALDNQGHVVYPDQVPPETHSPTSPRSSKTPEQQPKSQAQASSSGDPFASMRGSLSPPDRNPERGGPKGRSASDAAALYSNDKPFGSQQKLQRAETNINRPPAGPDEYASSTDSSTSSDEDERPEEREKRNKYRRFHVGNENYHTRGKVSKRDGRLTISVKDTSNTGYLAKALGTAARKVVPLKKDNIAGTEEQRGEDASKIDPSLTGPIPESLRQPKLNIVIMVIGSRGDAQPFLKVGKVLKEQYGHRVRIATHPAFRDFVEKDSGLEFFSIGGDPAELMSFMVKNPGMIPTLDTVKSGDISRRRASMAEMFEGFWRACINATDNEKNMRNAKMMEQSNPFVADAIIANPPSFAHVHCAEALGIPLHMMFTFPYTPTQAFPHPLASIKKSNVDPGYTNFISYPLVELMVWQGLGDLMNEFRTKTLGLDPVSTLWAPGATYRLHVPFTYLWSPGLVPKPEDWGSEIDVAGFVFLDLASSFKPPAALTKFLDAGDPPIYIGFGSIVVDDANRFTEMIFEAVKLAGVRALVSKGWGGLGKDSLDIPDNVFMLDNIPHDWLFPRVRACVIHGGAGTTAIALKLGKPTMIVPFFGDQHFWGSMVGSAGAGPEPVPYKDLTAEKLAEGIKFCLTDAAASAAQGIAKRIEAEGDGAENACRAFHKHLALSGKNSMRCSILEDRVAVWQLKNTNMRLSAAAANHIVSSGAVSYKKFRLLRHNEWNDFEGPGEPVTGLAGSIVTAAGNVFSGIGGVPYRFAKHKHQEKEKKEKHDEKKKKHEENVKRRREEKEAKAKRKATQSKQPARNGPPPPVIGRDHAASPTQPDPSPYTAADLSEDDTDSDGPNSRNLSRRDTQLSVTTVASHPAGGADDFVHEVAHGAAKTAGALARVPMDLSLALAQGFHNAPRLYGDDTVRRPTRVTGIKSGLRAAGHEFVYGVYDGWTGLVRLPVRGARDDGVRGFVKGVGMGVTGFVLKDIAALFGPVGYTLKGVVKQIDRGKQPLRHIRLARVVQGQREVGELSAEERREMGRRVEAGWAVMRGLWVALEEAERKRGGVRSRLGGRRRGRRLLGAAFESVETAEAATAALKRGEPVEAVVGMDRGRESEDRGKSTAAAYAEEQKSLKRRDTDKEGGGKPRAATMKAATTTTTGGGEAVGVLRKAQTTDGVVVPQQQHNGGEGCNGFRSKKLEGAVEEEQEERNPFSPSLKAVEKNRAEYLALMEREKKSKSPVAKMLTEDGMGVYKGDGMGVNGVNGVKKNGVVVV
ncbi:glycosyltransferase family 28 domain-containing protein [Podospora conica]|nr:glycosyltransferase family 28 domain-containing protein [Schizothecium conicum]